VIIAVTGGTGFVGSRFVDAALAAGHSIRALTRRPQPPRDGMTWVPGTLEDETALHALVSGSDAVVHVAGLTNAPNRAAFERSNVTGTEAVVEAARGANVRRFVHVSSLSAREPDLSNYGWSKAGAEAVVAWSQLDWVMVRPPAIYGPGDTDHIDLFKAARLGLVPLPPGGRLSVIHADDLARLLLALTNGGGSGVTYEADDGHDGGWSHADYARAIADAVGRKALLLPMPATLVRLGAKADRLFRGSKAKLTADRAAYFCHPDWMIDPTKRPPSDLWTPEIATAEGLKTTAAWYRNEGWL
jgi:UDP-glucose 4-epimerase